MNRRLFELLAYIAPRVPSSTHLRICVTYSDFLAYGRHGRSITETKWRKGREFMYPDGMSEQEWMLAGRFIWKLAQPGWAVLLGDLLAAWCVLRLALSSLSRSPARAP